MCMKTKFFSPHYGLFFYLPRKLIKYSIHLFHPIVLRLYPMPPIKTIEETIQVLINAKKSIIRYGDGEFQYILDKISLPYQEFDKDLHEGLMFYLYNETNEVIVGLPDCYRSVLDFKNGEPKKYWKSIVVLYLPRLFKIINPNKIYYNANISRFYYGYNDGEMVKRRFELIKEVWANRSILVVEGEKSRLGVGNDLFDGACQVRRILAPPHNAFRVLNELYMEVLKYDRDNLVLVALGTAAKVFVPRLAKSGYQAIDIGNIDMEYEWFNRKTDKKVIIPGKYNSEVSGGRVVSDIWDELYLSQIVKSIQIED
jgi:glycosyltransferase family protein